MVLISVTKFYKILIKTIRLRKGTVFQNAHFHKQRARTPEGHGAIWTIIEHEEDIMVLNNVTKFHNILIKTL